MCTQKEMMDDMRSVMNPCPFCGGDMPSNEPPDSPDYPIMHLPGHCIRKKAKLKPPKLLAEIRRRAWETRRKKYGPCGHR